jgi:hypothetical protein
MSRLLRRGNLCASGSQKEPRGDAKKTLDGLKDDIAKLERKTYKNANKGPPGAERNAESRSPPKSSTDFNVNPYEEIKGTLQGY